MRCVCCPDEDEMPDDIGTGEENATIHPGRGERGAQGE